MYVLNLPCIPIWPNFWPETRCLLISSPLIHKFLNSGYYPTQPDGTKKPWRFDLIRKKFKKLVLLSSVDDPFIPVNEPRLLAKELGLTHIEIKGDGSNSVAPPVEQNTYDGVYFEFTDGGHFMTQSFKTLRSIINAVIPICDA
jgi:hypothetical protein